MLFYAGVVICLSVLDSTTCDTYTNSKIYNNEKSCSKYMEKLENQFEKIKFDWKNKDQKWYVNGGCMKTETPSDNVKLDLYITYGPDEKVDL